MRPFDFWSRATRPYASLNALLRLADMAELHCRGGIYAARKGACNAPLQERSMHGIDPTLPGNKFYELAATNLQNQFGSVVDRYLMHWIFHLFAVDPHSTFLYEAFRFA